MRDFFKSRSFKVLAGVVLVLLGVVLVVFSMMYFSPGRAAFHIPA